MTHHTHLEDTIGGDDNFRAWKYIISLILAENDLDHYITGEVTELEVDEAKATHKENLVKAKRIIAYSIKDHLIPHVSSIKTLKGSILCFDKDVRRKEHQPKDDREEPVEDCEDTELEDYTVLLHKGFSNQGTT